MIEEQMPMANKGEWSEVYALFKLLADGRLIFGDKHLHAIEDFVLSIKEILLPIGKTDTLAKYQILNQFIQIEIKGITPIKIKRSTFLAYAEILLKEIQKGHSSFSIPQVWDFLTSLNKTAIKSPSQNKADIYLRIDDPRTGIQPQLGFSIKSKLGSPSTLLNASSATNFIYQVLDSPIDVINQFNIAKNFKTKFSALPKGVNSLSFNKIDNICFANNLRLIDSLLPELLAQVLLIYYSGKASKISDIVEILKTENPLDYDLTEHDFYGYKIKKFLVEVALGMVPNTPWLGIYAASGGYIIVKEDGGIVGYHFYDRNLFESYLLENTRLDTPSTQRHKFGSITSDGSLKLNLQIRFL